MSAVASETGVYVYGVVPAGSALEPPTRTELVAAGGLVAVTERVRVDDLRRDAAAGGDRLAGRALAHQDLLAGLLAAGLAVVPFRFGTVVASPADVESLLLARADELRAASAAVAGRVELGVRLRLEEEEVAAASRASEPRLAGLAAAAAQAGPGAAHLRGRQLARLEAETLAAERRRRAARLHEILSAHAVASRVAPLPVGADARAVVLAAAYLVERDAESSFRAVAARTRGELGAGARVEVTGPWPAYSFVDGGSDDGR